MSAKRQLKKPDLPGFFARHPAFTLFQLSEALGGSHRKAAARERAKYHLSRGRLKAVSRGVYAVVPPGVSASRFQPDRYLVAAAIQPNGIFSHHAALELLGFAHSDWNVCAILTERRRPRLRLNGVELVFLQPPPVLRPESLWQIGTRRVERLGQPLRVTGPERTLLDGFRQPRLVGGLGELVESAAGFGALDLELMKRLLGLYDHRMLYGAAGWFLERHQKEFFVPPAYLSDLEKQRPRSRQYLPRGQRRGGTLVSRWNLVLPENIAGGKGVGEA